MGTGTASLNVRRRRVALLDLAGIRVAQVFGPAACDGDAMWMEDAVRAAHEFATNALLGTKGPCAVRVRHLPDQRGLRVEVGDPLASPLPSVTAATSTTVGTRCAQLVRAAGPLLSYLDPRNRQLGRTLRCSPGDLLPRSDQLTDPRMDQ